MSDKDNGRGRGKGEGGEGTRRGEDFGRIMRGSGGCEGKWSFAILETGLGRCGRRAAASHLERAALPRFLLLLVFWAPPRAAEAKLNATVRARVRPCHLASSALPALFCGSKFRNELETSSRVSGI